MNKQKNCIIPKGLRLKSLGYQWMILLCLALLILSAWEFWVRVDAMSKPLAMFFDMALGEGIPLNVAMQYFDWNMVEPLGWLLICMTTGLVSLVAARRPIGSSILMPVCVVLAVYGLTRDGSILPSSWYLVQPGILLGMSAIDVVNLSTYRIRRKHLIENIRMANDAVSHDEEVSDIVEEVEMPIPLTENTPPERETVSVHAAVYFQETSRPIRTRKAVVLDDDFSDIPRLTDAPRLRRLAQEPPISHTQPIDDTQSA